MTNLRRKSRYSEESKEFASLRLFLCCHCRQRLGKGEAYLKNRLVSGHAFKACYTLF